MQTSYPGNSPLDGMGLKILRNCLDILDEPTTTRGQAAIKVVGTLINCSGKPSLINTFYDLFEL
jgi:hypothetical protein